MAQLDTDEAYRRFAQARVARLATVTPQLRPHLVPVVFAVVGTPVRAVVYSAVDAKPKRSSALARLANVRANPAVTLLADHYADDWTQLWWVRADGRGRVLESDTPEAREAVTALGARYPQHRAQPPAGPVLAVDVDAWSGWAYRP